MTADITFHYPPELFSLMVDAIPVLNKSKRDVLLCFRGAGVADAPLKDLEQRLKADKESLGKYGIARIVLDRLNARGEAALREQREVLRRIVEFTNFDACWANDQMKAKGIVASIRDIVNRKDSFTRMNQVREEERQARIAIQQKDIQAKQERAAKIAAAKQDFSVCSGRQRPHNSAARCLIKRSTTSSLPTACQCAKRSISSESRAKVLSSRSTVSSNLRAPFTSWR
jgi:restriction system protein